MEERRLPPLPPPPLPEPDAERSLVAEIVAALAGALVNALLVTMGAAVFSIFYGHGRVAGAVLQSAVFFSVWNGAIALGVALPRGVRGRGQAVTVLCVLATVGAAPTAAGVGVRAIEAFLSGAPLSPNSLIGGVDADRLVGGGFLLALVSLARLGLWSWMADRVHEPAPGETVRIWLWLGLGLIGSCLVFPFFLCFEPVAFAMLRSHALSWLAEREGGRDSSR